MSTAPPVRDYADLNTDPRYERVADGEDEVQDLPCGCVIVADVNGLASRGNVQIDEGA
jgi:hypothetical protein